MQKLSRVMRLTALLLLGFGLHVAAKTHSQEITYSGTNVPLKQVFRDLKESTGLVFIYEPQLLQNAEPVTIDADHVPLTQFLSDILAHQQLDFFVKKNTVVIKAKKAAPKITEQLQTAPPIQVRGQVVDQKGVPVSGVTVMIKGTSIGAITGPDGSFNLSVPDELDAKTLFVSSIGFQFQEVAIRGKFLRIQLEEGVNVLDQTVIIAYGTTTKRFNTGNISTVKAEDIAKSPVNNPLQAIQGRVPGLFIQQTTGVPGGGFSIALRGQNSLLNANDPFFVVDGVPYASQTLGTINGNLRGGNPLNFINPSDIESIEVLKDADATSIYGSRAANGAILITTKQGRAGRMNLDLNLYAGIGKVTRKMDLLNTQQYLEMRNEAFKNDGAAPNPNRDFDLTFWDTTKYTDWQEELIGNTASYSDAQITVSGGSEHTQYLMGGGYHRETTVYPGNTRDVKASVHFKINTSSPDNRFKVMLAANYIADNNSVLSVDQTGTALSLAPNAPALYNEDGSLNWQPRQMGQVGTWINPLNLLNTEYKGRTNNLVSNAVLGYNIVRGFELKASFGYTNLETNELFVRPTTFFDPGRNVASGSSVFSTANIRSWIAEPQATYKLNVFKGTLTLLIGATFQRNTNDKQRIDATGFTNDVLLKNVLSASSINITEVINSEYKYNAFFGRINYNWKDKYIINLNARRDGSSRFGPENRFNTFGSLGLGWIFSQESFIRNNLPFITFGKLRGSYGSTGNDGIGDYRFLDLYNSTQHSYQQVRGLYPGSLFNPLLSWERNRKLEGALELGFLNNGIRLDLSYYANRSDNQLVTRPLSAMTGFLNIAANLPALIENTGWELSLNTVNIKTRNLEWSSSFNLTIPKNKLIRFPDFSTSGYQFQYIIGEPVTIKKTYSLVSVNDSSGLYLFADDKNSPTNAPSDLTDMTSIQNLAPQYYGGLENTFRYKGFALSVLFQFVKQTGQNAWGAIATTGRMPGTAFNQPVEVLDRWQSPGDSKTLQRFSQNFGGEVYPQLTYMAYSNFTYSDASFIRLKNLSLSWQLPSMWTKKLHVQNFRTYIQGQNLLTFTKYLGLDPETQGLILPPLRVITFGFQVSL